MLYVQPVMCVLHLCVLPPCVLLHCTACEGCPCVSPLCEFCTACAWVTARALFSLGFRALGFSTAAAPAFRPLGLLLASLQGGRCTVCAAGQKAV